MNIRERVSRIALGPHLMYAAGWTMRVWREEPVSKNSFSPSHTGIDDDVLRTIQRLQVPPAAPHELAAAVLALERVNAVEIVDMSGAGEVHYKDWP